MHVDGFTLHRHDRDALKTEKKSGGVCLYVNDMWYHPNHTTVKTTISSPDIELLVVGCQAYYLPREVSHVIARCRVFF